MSARACLLAVALVSACGPDAPVVPGTPVLTDAVRIVGGPVVVLRNVTVIDGTGSPPRPHVAVVIRDGIIAAVEPVEEVAFSGEARVVDLPGCHVVPGFVDMHAHVTVLPVQPDGSLATRYDRVASLRVLRMLLAAGVTTVRNPAAPTEDGIALREAVAAGEALGPRILTAGRALNRVDGTFGPFVATRDATAVREEVRRQAAAGVDFVKVYGALSPELVGVAIDEAHTRGLRVVGHLQRTTWTQGARLGIDAITHAAPWSPDYLPEALRAEYRPTLRGRVTWLENVDLDGAAIREMLDVMVEHNVTVDPTLVALHTKFLDDARRYREHPALALLPATIREGWLRGTSTSHWTEPDFRAAQAVWPQVLELTRRLHARGVLLTAGSDLPNPWVIPGVSFHEELALLVDAGIPPSEVLRIATYNGALALGLDGSIGSVTVGKRADLVVLAADPLLDIRNTRHVELVVQGGRLHRPADLLDEP